MFVDLWVVSEDCLTAEAVQGATLAFQSVDYIHGGDGLSLGVLRVGDGIPDHVLQENLEDSTGLFVDEAADSLDTTSSGKTTDGRLGDTLDVITENFAMTLGASLSKTFSSLSTSRHFVVSMIQLRATDAEAANGAVYMQLLINIHKVRTG